jgi:uncharacterized protein YbjQ (UPF0145 family)
MLVSTTDAMPGKTITRVIGLVRGNTVRTRFIMKDMLAGLKNMIGGEISEYTQMLDDAREEALGRMIKDAEAQAITDGAAEMLAYGTAVVVE